MQTVGEYLKRERQARDLSVREISRATKISECYLEFLERDEYGKLPQGPYIKGYISSYARLINVDVERALKLYETKRESPKKSAATHLEKRSWWAAKRLTAKERRQADDQTGKVAATDRLKDWATKIVGALFKAISNILQNLEQVWRGIINICKAMILWSKKVYANLFSAKTNLPTRHWEHDEYQSETDLRPTLQRLRNPKRWLAGCTGGIAAALLILAGFGIYHLFFYQEFAPSSHDLLRQSDQSANQKVLPSTADSRLSKKTPKEIDPELGRTPAKKAPSSAETMTARPPKDTPIEADKIEKNNLQGSSSKPAEESLHSASPISPQKAAETAASKSASIEKPGVNEAPRPLPASSSTADSVRIVKANTCQEIADRMPAKIGNLFPWSIPQVYVWSLISAEKTPTVIHHVYYLNDKKISDVTLKVASHHWRTWSRKHILDEDLKGSWRVDITTAKGRVLRTLFFEIH